MKRCEDGRACGGHNIPLSNFGTHQRRKDGLNGTCRKCAAQLARELRAETPEAKAVRIAKRRANIDEKQKVSVERAFKRVKPSRHKAEADAILLYSANPHTEVRILQAGTHADAIERPKGCTEDLWIPLQVKTSKVRVFKGCDGYGNMDILCIENLNCFLFDGAFVTEHQSQLAGGKNITIGKSNVWHKKPQSFADVAMHRGRRWQLSKAKMPERHFRLQANTCAAKEYLQIEMSRRFDENVSHAWAIEPYAVHDRTIDGVPVQDKVARKNNQNASFCATVLHSVGNVHIPYLLGDIPSGFFNFGVHVEEAGVYLEWRIPENIMEQHSYLAHIEDGKCTKSAKQTICLHVASCDGTNHDLSMKIFGKVPRKPYDDWTTSYLKVCCVA